MKIRRVRLSSFRNFDRLTVDLADRVCFFVGDNGQGKTNLLESVYLLSHGSSFRPGSLGHLIQNGQTSAAVYLSGISDRQIPVEMQLKLMKPTSDQCKLSKDFVLNNKRASMGDSYGVLPTVLFSPESLNSIKSGPDSRRELIDSVIRCLDSRGADRLRQYAKALKSRNRLLRQIADGDRSNETLRTLESLTRVFLLLGTEVTCHRIKVIQLLRPRFESTVQWLLGDRFLTGLDYVISEVSANNFSEDQVYDALSRRSVELRSAEMQSGTSLVGPHKHELSFKTWSGEDARYCASQGQQRALILALKIAQIDLHRETAKDDPVILLDDVMSELDDTRRTRLVEYLSQTNAQVLMTATDLTWPQRMGGTSSAVFSVRSGTVTDEVDATGALTLSELRRDVEPDV